MLEAILLIVLGILAVPSLILSKKPDAKELLDKITPYQGYIGVVFVFWGIWEIISCILNLSILTSYPIIWIFALLIGLVEVGLGFIMGYALIAQHALSKNPEAAKKGEELLAKLTPLKGKLGIASIILGILYIILRIVIL